MENCGFHHGHFTEAVLHDILNEHGVHLLFQPAYSPHLNTCEFCFHQVKCYLKQNSSLTADETEISIGEAVSKISPANSIAYFRKCGYVWLTTKLSCHCYFYQPVFLHNNKKNRLLLNCKKCFQAQLAKLTAFLSPKEDFIEMKMCRLHGLAAVTLHSIFILPVRINKLRLASELKA